MMDNDTVKLSSELHFRDYRHLFSDAELIAYTAHGLDFSVILKEAEHRANHYLIESYGGGSYSLHKRKGNKVLIDGSWRTVFSGGYITHHGRTFFVSASTNNILLR